MRRVGLHDIHHLPAYQTPVVAWQPLWTTGYCRHKSVESRSLSHGTHAKDQQVRQWRPNLQWASGP